MRSPGERKRLTVRVANYSIRVIFRDIRHFRPVGKLAVRLVGYNINIGAVLRLLFITAYRLTPLRYRVRKPRPSGYSASLLLSPWFFRSRRFSVRLNIKLKIRLAALHRYNARAGVLRKHAVLGEKRRRNYNFIAAVYKRVQRYG